MSALIPLTRFDDRTVTVAPCEVCEHDCLCAVDIPPHDGQPAVHLDVPEHPEVIATQEFPNTQEVLVRFDGERPARVFPPTARVTVYRPPARRAA